jgi:hypothetical protein
MSQPEYDFLNQEPPEEAVTAPEAQVETPAAPAPAAPTVADPVTDDRVPLAALKAEREKRQDYERRLREYEARERQAQQQQQEPAPTFFEAPEQYVQQVVQRERHQMTQSLHMALEAEAREAFADYDEVLAELAEQARDNPVLREQVFSSPNPAKAAYKLGKQLREMKSMQDPAAYRAKVELEVRAQIAKEAEAAAAAKAKDAAALPPDLSAVRSTRAQEVPVDDSLEAILKSRKR